MIFINNICLIDNQEPVELTTPQTFEVGKDGCLSITLLHFQGESKLRIILAGDNARCTIKCVYLSNKNNQNNIEIEVIHKHENTYSNQVIKGVATDSSRVSFKGMIRIPPKAQHCEGTQNHRGILLSDTATITAVPELEIYADDVKCTHGSAIGSLETSALFYLMSRGIERKTARRLLLTAFLSDILPDRYQVIIEDWVSKNV